MVHNAESHVSLCRKFRAYHGRLKSQPALEASKVLEMNVQGNGEDQDSSDILLSIYSIQATSLLLGATHIWSGSSFLSLWPACQSCTDTQSCALFIHLAFLNPFKMTSQSRITPPLVQLPGAWTL